jgi:hypothetical protein
VIDSVEASRAGGVREFVLMALARDPLEQHEGRAEIARHR